MKWLDEKIEKYCQEYLRLHAHKINEAAEELKVRLDEIKNDLTDFLLKEMSEKTDSKQQFKKLQDESLSIREDMEHGFRRLYLSMSENDRKTKEDVELIASGLTKHFDKRLNDLGEKKGIVVELLKKIAALEK